MPNDASGRDGPSPNTSADQNGSRGRRGYGLRLWARQRRYAIRRNPALHLGYRISVGVVGAAVLVVGIFAIPYPGPGWLIVFIGLGILASEFGWAQRILQFARDKYDRWVAWMKRSHWSVGAAMGVATLAAVVGSLWVVNGLGTMAGWVDIEAQWLRGPFA